MKWGVRRWQNQDGSLTPAGRKHYGVMDSRSKAGSEDLSDEELNSRVKRLQQEAQYEMLLEQKAERNKSATRKILDKVTDKLVDKTIDKVTTRFVDAVFDRQKYETARIKSDNEYNDALDKMRERRNKNKDDKDNKPDKDNNGNKDNKPDSSTSGGSENRPESSQQERHRRMDRYNNSRRHIGIRSDRRDVSTSDTSSSETSDPNARHRRMDRYNRNKPAQSGSSGDVNSRFQAALDAVTERNADFERRERRRRR